MASGKGSPSPQGFGLRLVPDRMLVASLRTNAVALGTRALLRCLLFDARAKLVSSELCSDGGERPPEPSDADKSNRERSCVRVLSITDTDEGLSVLMCEDVLPLFEGDLADQRMNPVLTVSSDRLRAIEVLEGAEIINETGYVAALSRCLALADIDVMYVSTFTTDLLLVAENEAQRALDLLRAHSAGVMRRIAGGDKLPIPQLVGDANLVCSVLPHEYVVGFLIADIEVASFPLTREVLRSIGTGLDDHPLFSVTASERDTSFIMTRDTAKRFPAGVLDIHGGSWKIVQTHNTGMVKSSVSLLSRVLARAGIEIYFLSTFHADLLLVPSSKLDVALAALEEDLVSQMKD